MARKKGKLPKGVKRGGKGKFVSTRKAGKARRKSGRKASRRAAALKGWRKRARKGFGRKLKSTRVKRHARFLKNPIGRKGAFKLLPSMAELQGAAVRGAGAVAADVLLATGYSLANIRPSTSLAEDAVGRIGAGIALGAGVGYLLGGKVAEQVREGTFTVALYKLVAGVVSSLPGEADPKGGKKLLGFLRNPFTEEAKRLIPGLGDLGVVVPERDIIPVGDVVPEGQVLPLGEDVPSRFGSRF